MGRPGEREGTIAALVTLPGWSRRGEGLRVESANRNRDRLRRPPGSALRPVVVKRGVPCDLPERDGVIEDQMGEEPAVLIRPRRVIGEEEAVLLELLPEPFRSQRVILGPVPGTYHHALEGAADRVVELPVAELHGRGGDDRVFIRGSPDPTTGPGVLRFGGGVGLGRGARRIDRCEPSLEATLDLGPR